MESKIKARLEHWGGSLVRSCVKGAATALTAFMGAAGASASGLPVAPMSLKQGAGVAAFAAVYEAVKFLSVNPVPDEDDDTPEKGAAA